MPHPTPFTAGQIRLSHAIDDGERTRTRALRCITREVRMLTDALSALDNGDLDVVREFVERSRDALLAERDKLRAETPARAAD